MQTIVVLVDGLWLVDYWSTKQSTFNATFDISMKWFASTLDNADTYVEDILGAENEADALKFAEERLTEEFARVKESILKNYKARLDPKKELRSGSTQPVG